MTGADPGEQRWWGLAEVLREAAAQVRIIAGALVAARPDERGREWAERAGLVHRALLRELDAIEVLLDAARRVRSADGVATGGEATDQAGTGGAGTGQPGPAARFPARSTGRALLGATSGDRVDPTLGPRIATLAGDDP